MAVKKADPLDALLADATVIKKKKSESKKQRETLDLSPAEALAFDRFCMSDAAMKVTKGHQEGSKAVILPVLIDHLLRHWCAEGHRTENPRIQTANGQAILQARENLRFDIPANEDGEPGTIADALVSVGFDAETAETIREREFTESTELRFASINKLRDDPTTRKVADRLLKLVLENFSTEERSLLLEKVNHVTLNEGFLDRAVAHADRDPTKLKALLQVVRPTYLMSGVTYNGKLEDAIASLQQNTPEPVTSSIPAAATAISEQFATEDGQWTAKATGNVAKLFMNEIEMASKVCAGGPSHAAQTCKKWMRDPNYRAETLAKK